MVIFTQLTHIWNELKKISSFYGMFEYDSDLFFFYRATDLAIIPEKIIWIY